MNVTLIHPCPAVKFHVGLAYISSVLKNSGHTTSYLPLTFLAKKVIEEEIAKNSTQLIFITTTNDSYDLCQKIVSFVRQRYDIPVVLGGIHPTICPEEAIETEGIIGICRGEGEYASLELCDALQKKEDYTKIQNLWIKTSETILKNDLRPLIQNLDELPFPDYSIFEKNRIFTTLPVILSRGCPYRCTYCCNHSLQTLYQSKGKYLRYHSVDYAIKFITRLLEQFPTTRFIEFYDDTFTLHQKWLQDFLKEFANLGVKFICNTRFDLIDENIAKMLYDSGCVRVNAAIEAGSEKIRNEILKRNLTDSKIIEHAQIVRKHGILLHTHNMVGIPCETEENIIETIKLNQVIQAETVQVSIFNPYPKSDLHKLCQEKKLDRPQIEGGNFSRLYHPENSFYTTSYRKLLFFGFQIVNLQKRFYFTDNAAHLLAFSHEP